MPPKQAIPMAGPPIDLMLDLTAVTVFRQVRPALDGDHYSLVIFDGHQTAELIGGGPRLRTASVFGAQRCAAAFLMYAVDLALCDIPTLDE